MKDSNNAGTQVLLYQTDDGTTRIDVRKASETVWLNQMADLFLRASGKSPHAKQ